MLDEVWPDKVAESTALWLGGIMLDKVRLNAEVG